MIWIKFILFTAVIVVAANFLAKYGNVIAIRTRLGGMFIGVILLAAATSLPEVLTSMSAVNQGTPNIAAGNIFGSNTFNMLLLAVVDLAHRNQRILRKVANRHALTGSLVILLMVLTLFFLQANIDIKFGWMGLDSLILIVVYLVGVKLIAVKGAPVALESEEIPIGTPKLWQGLLGFLAAAAVLVIVTPMMVRTSNEIAEVTGLGTTFVGSTLVALATSLPELVTTIAAIRIGAADMAVGNLLGSNMFNIFTLGLTDAFFTDGRFLAAIDPAFMLLGLLGLLMTVIGLLGNIVRFEKRFLFVEIDSFLLILVYLAGMWLLYQRGMG